MLAFRPHTRSELTTKLTDKGYDKACIERSINRLQELVSLCCCYSCGSQVQQSAMMPTRPSAVLPICNFECPHLGMRMA